VGSLPQFNTQVDRAIASVIPRDQVCVINMATYSWEWALVQDFCAMATIIATVFQRFWKALKEAIRIDVLTLLDQVCEQ
jgi:hypothetical protein